MLSFAVTAYREMSEDRLCGGRLLRCIQAAQNHEAIDEIVVVDDGSPDYEGLRGLLENRQKVSFSRHATNVGIFANKIEAIARAKNSWVITCDSDNVMGEEYIDTVVSLKKDTRVWYCPSFARPHFDYRNLIGVYDKRAFREFLRQPLSRCAVNTGNQVVHRDSFVALFRAFRGVKRFDLLLPNYLQVKDRNDEKWHQVYGANDSFLLIKLWVEAGNKIGITEGLEYDHFVPKRHDYNVSNYNRAPKEKGELALVLANLMMGEANDE